MKVILPRALSWTERAIGADGKTDFQDFEALFLYCIIHLRSGEFNQIQGVAQRIIALLPSNDEDIRQYVAVRFYNFGLEIYQMGIANGNIGLLKAARSFFIAAKTFDPDDEDTKQLKGRLDQIIHASEQFDFLEKDSLISSGFSMVAAFYLTSALDQEIEDKDTVFENIVNVILSSSPTDIVKSVKRIKSYYFAIYQLNESFFNKIEKIAQESIPKSGLFSGMGKFLGFG